MEIGTFQDSVKAEQPPSGLSPGLAALWWEAKGDWARAHGLVDALETTEGMAVHAYLHRREGADWNANYWYRRAGRGFYRPDLGEEWRVLVEGLLPG